MLLYNINYSHKLLIFECGSLTNIIVHVKYTRRRKKYTNTYYYSLVTI